MNASRRKARLFGDAVNTLSIPPGEYGRKIKLKGIDGDPHKWWSMWFNSKIREEPYLALTLIESGRDTGVPACRNLKTGAARLSSARVVRCWVKSRNERNPRR